MDILNILKNLLLLVTEHVLEFAMQVNPLNHLLLIDLVIAVTSGNFTQRGEVSIINKFDKTKAALKYGVDLVVELPYIYTVQNGNEFAKKAVQILNALGTTDIVFGSETNNMEELNKMSSFNIKVDNLKEIMSTGASYPKAYGLLASALFPNDILAVSYLKAISKTNIKAYTIKRTTKSKLV